MLHCWFLSLEELLKEVSVTLFLMFLCYLLGNPEKQKRVLSSS